MTRLGEQLRPLALAVMLAGAAGGVGITLAKARPALAQANDQRPWFGVELAARKDGRAGVLARHVVRTSPADSAGIKDGDGILAMGGKVVKTPQEVIAEVRARRSGDVIEVSFERGTTEQKAKVTLGIFPDLDEMLRRDKIGTFAPPLAGVVAVQGVVPERFGGKVTVVEFWASWCGACRVMAPLLSELSAKLTPQGLVVIGMSSDTPQVAAKAAREFGSTYAIGADKDERVFPAYSVTATPTVFVIDKRGVIRGVTVGLESGGLSKLEALVKTLLAEKAP